MAIGVVRELTRVSVSVAAARQPALGGGIPNAPGFYAWWLAAHTLLDVPRTPHPVEPLSLMYELRPPLNVDFNAGHPFYGSIRTARADLVANARPA